MTVGDSTRALDPAGGGGPPLPPAGRLVGAESLAAYADVAPDTIRSWCARREYTTHPEPSAVIDGVSLWAEEQWITWWTSRRQRIADSFTDLDLCGDPDDLVGPAEIARMLHYSSHRVVHTYLLRRQAGFPEPDEVVVVAGRKIRRWTRRRVWDWAVTRGQRYRGPRPATTQNAPRSC